MMYFVLGNIALILALCVAVTQAVLPMVGVYKNKLSFVNKARSLAFIQTGCISFAFLLLTFAFINNQFSLAYVAANSNSHLPLIYRICAVWGAHEGSLLLWVTILGVWMSAVALYAKQLPGEMLAQVLSVLAMVSIGFLLFIIFTSNPFMLNPDLWVTNGRDLNPLLQDPGLVSHPPMLYMGYVGFSVVFAFGISALLTGRLDQAWARVARPWTLAAWSFLTLGITLGSWWAYRQLGWGGWWFWDPVENASFMPWLSGTALLHSLIVAEKRNTFKSWTILLAIITFSLSLLGTFLVRSGVLISVHAFAVDPMRGAFILAFLICVIGGSLALYMLRVHMIKSDAVYRFLSREVFLLSNNLFLVVMMLTVLLGTLYPLIIQALNIGKLSVGAPYFNTVMIPLSIPFLVLMGVAPLFYWRETNWSAIKLRFFVCVGVAVTLGLTLPTLCLMTFNLKLSLATTLSALILITALLTSLQITGGLRFRSMPLSRYGMIVAHCGLAMAIFAIVVTSLFSVQRDVKMSPGESVTLSGYRIVFKRALPIDGPNYRGARAIMTVKRLGHRFETDGSEATLTPELRRYIVSGMTIPKADVNVSLFKDVYIALAEPLKGEAWGFRLYYKPMVRWIWYGGLLMCFGGVLACLRRKRNEER